MLRKLLSIVMIALTVTLSVLPGANAVTATQGQGLEISPPLLELKADPGQPLTAQIRLRNITGETVVTRAQYDDFVSGGEEGQPKLLLNSKEKSPYSIKDWLSSVPSLTLAPGEQKAVDLSIAVPAKASPGGHYGVIRFTAAPPEVDQSAVSLAASVGTLILVSVSGNVVERAQVAELYVAKNDHKKSLVEYGPLDIVTRIRNTGNVHIKPSGTIRVSNMLGRETASFQLNQQKGNVLPGSVRKFQNNLDKKLLFGRYTVQVDMVYGTDQRIITATSSFWAVPYKLIVVAVGLVALLVLLVKRYNRYILNRAAKQNDKKPKKQNKS